MFYIRPIVGSSFIMKGLPVVSNKTLPWLLLVAIFTGGSATAPKRQMRRANVEPEGDALLQADVTSDSSAEQRIAALESQVASLTATVQHLVAELKESKRQTHHSQELVMDSSRMPSSMTGGLAHAQTLNVADRLRYLERKVDGSLNWLTDPQLWRQHQYHCKNLTDMGTSGEHHVCLDNFKTSEDPARPCVAYDLGIRANPEFGASLLEQYGCKVHAYDPSDKAAQWWRGDDPGTIPAERLKNSSKGHYLFHPQAAGGTDGPLMLFEFNWQQVSIVHGEHDLTIDKKYRNLNQREFKVNAKTLPTMMKENGDDQMDFLKIDIEGSEYALLQHTFDTMGCPPAGQITVEYHNFMLDERYGSSPEINAIHNLLNSCGFKSFMVRDHWRNFVREETDNFYLPPKRFTLASYCRDCWN